jgi:DNA replication protein DnaC
VNTTETSSRISTSCARCLDATRIAGSSYCERCAALRAKYPESGLDVQRRIEQLVSDYPRAAGVSFRTIDVDAELEPILRRIQTWPYRLDDLDAEPFETLWLFGRCGVGKTTCAICAAKHWLEWNDGEAMARFVNFRELAAACRAAWTRGQRVDPIQDLIDERPGLLVLDDLGCERVSERSREGVGRLTEARYRDPYANTIITTNYTPADLARRLGGGEDIEGQRIVSRLRQDALVVELAGRDRRVADHALSVAS